MIYNFEIEKQLLAGLIKESQHFSQISNFIGASDFYSEQSNLHSAIFTIIKQAIDAGDEIDEIIIAQRINSIGLSFEDNLNPSDYIKSLALRKVPAGNLVKTAKELKKFSIRREIFNSSQEMAKAMKSISPESSYQQIVECADGIYNSKINLYEIGKDVPENIYADMEDIIEERGNNPITEFGMMGPHPKVNEIYGSLLRPGNITVIVARSGVGKMNPLYTKVLTPNGFTEMKNILVGSKIVCPSGKISTVIKTFDHKQKDIYRVTFEDGRFSDCGIDHLWKIWTRDNKGFYNWQVSDTQKIINDLSQKSKRVYIPLVSEISHIDKDFNLDPYIVGALIGDGCLRDGFVIESADVFIPNKIKSLLKEDCEVSIRENPKSKSKTYRFFTSKGGAFKNPLIESLKNLGLYGKLSYDKFIPEEYFLGSFDQRLSLLQGLMDTDGTLSESRGRSGEYSSFANLSYSTSSEQLSKDVQRLVWSLGGKAKISKRIPTYKNSNEEKISGAMSYNVRIKIANPKSAFSIPRKKDLALSGTDYQYSDLKLRISSVEKLENKEDCRCIEIEDGEHLYIIDEYIVTHNTQFCMHYATRVSEKYNVPVLHFDNGEMSKEELVMRQCAALSGVPMHLIESGNWRRAGQDIVDKVRSVWTKIKHLQFYYYNVGGMDVDSMVDTLKRFYYSKVGRGNQMIFSFDYIKTTSESSAGKSEWQTVGEMVDKFKKCIQKEILEDGNPVIPMITSVQSNRSGITNNRMSANVIDDESVVSLSDRITQFCSHMFILRNKTADEIQTEGVRFGTHKLINVKSRHLGKDIAGAIEPVRIGDTLRKNFVNLEFANFNIAERGDLRDIARTLDGDEELDDTDNNDQIPNFDRF
jgi:replicative DNA helicase